MSNPYIKIEPRDHYLLVTVMSDEVSVLMGNIESGHPSVVAHTGVNVENDEVFLINHFGEKASLEAGQVLSIIHDRTGLSQVDVGSVNRLLMSYWLALVNDDKVESIIIRRHLPKFNKDLDSILVVAEAHNLIVHRDQNGALMDLRISETNNIVTIHLEVP